MPDTAARRALRSEAPLVLVEAPAGCGKTYQGADYAAEGDGPAEGRTLILAHTHAACDAFSLRTRKVARSVEVRTIDSLVAEVAEAYRPSLGLDCPPQVWVRGREDGFGELAIMVAAFMARHPMVASAISSRFPVMICDEHQDASPAQHNIVMALHAAGSKVRFFGDEMQRIYFKGAAAAEADAQWTRLKEQALVERLTHPHRWDSGSAELGKWVLKAREALLAGGSIDLRGKHPAGMLMITAENVAQRNLAYQPDPSARSRISNLVKNAESLLVLSPHNETVKSLRAEWGRRLPIWEGHTRYTLVDYVAALQAADGSVAAVCEAVIAFCQAVFTGFTDSAFANRLRKEVAEGACGKARGAPAELQAMAQLISDRPDHRGAAAALERLQTAQAEHEGFSGLKLDYSHEFWDAVRLGAVEDAEEALTKVIAARAHRPRPLPAKAISTVHKAKGLQAENVLILPCDAKTFKEKDRCLLYVALSRASHSLTLVVSRAQPSPLLRL